MPETIKRTTGTKVAFGDVVQLSKERSKDPEADGFERYIGLEHLEPSDLKVRSWGDLADGVTFTNVFRPGQVLFGKRRAYQRKVAVADFSGVCSGDIYVLEPKDEQLLPDLLPFICQSEPFYDYVISMSQGGLSPRVNWKALAKYEFALPPLEEQRRIAEVLLQVQRLEESFITLRTATQQLIDSRSRSLFEYDLNSGTRKFSDVVRDWAYGPRFSSGLYKENGTLAQLRTTDINEEGEICYETIPLVDLDPADYDDHLLRDGDLVMSRSGSCGMTAVFGEQDTPTIAAAFMFRISPSPEIDSRYLHEFFTSCLGQQLTTSLARGGVQKNIKGSQLLDQQIPCPSAERQEEVTFELSSLRNVSRSANARLIALSRLRRSLLTSLEGTAQ